MPLISYAHKAQRLLFKENYLIDVSVSKHCNFSHCQESMVTAVELSGGQIMSWIHELSNTNIIWNITEWFITHNRESKLVSYKNFHKYTEKWPYLKKLKTRKNHARKIHHTYKLTIETRKWMTEKLTLPSGVQDQKKNHDRKIDPFLRSSRQK